MAVKEKEKHVVRHAVVTEPVPVPVVEVQPPLVGAMGWLPDIPDLRDYTLQHENVVDMAHALRLLPKHEVVPELVNFQDLRAWFPPVEDQGTLGSCTANAGVGILEYMERRAHGKHVDGSRLFLYKATRDLLGWTGDTGAYLRTTMGAMVLFGVPPEKYWKYQVTDYDKEPPPFCWSFAQNYQAMRYVRLDPPGITRDALLAKIKAGIAAGIPAMFGFSVYSSIVQARTTGMIPFPLVGESLLGGHAVVACGYDDALLIRNATPGGPETRGALMIRNSWGTAWGNQGYGWLPYEYVLRGLAVDWWVLLKAEWVDTKNFGLPA